MVRRVLAVMVELSIACPGRFPCRRLFMMEDKSLVEEQTSEPLHTRRITTYVAAGLIAISGLVYAAHEHHSAQALATENQQEMAQLNATRSQIDALSAQIRQLAANEQAASQAAQPE